MFWKLVFWLSSSIDKICTKWNHFRDKNADVLCVHVTVYEQVLSSSVSAGVLRALLGINVGLHQAS